MKIVIATGIYPPEAGGPAYYAGGLARSFEKLGHTVRVVTYGQLKKLPLGVRHIAYAFRLIPAMWGADVVMALDTFSVALPAAFVASMLRVPFFIRTGGDFLWEQYLGRTRELIPLVHFYDVPRKFSAKERLIFALTKWTLARARIIFSTEMQRDIWRAPYAIDLSRTYIVGNAVEPPLPSVAPTSKNYLWHVRPNAIKNEAHVRAAFAKAKAAHPDIVLEDGTMPKAQLLERLKSCYAVILPSVTEISPNNILDALRFHKPFIMDKYSGLAKELGAYGTLVDPLDEDDIARAIGRLAEPEGYAEACAKASRFSMVRTYDDVAGDFLALIKHPV
jgi:glycosyltransferase involved in cell wall biosynthesis